MPEQQQPPIQPPTQVVQPPIQPPAPLPAPQPVQVVQPAQPLIQQPVQPIGVPIEAPVMQPAPQPVLPQQPSVGGSMIAPVALPTGTVATPTVPVATEKKSLHNLLNAIKLNNVVLTAEVGLGDALYRLAVAIGRSGVRFDENGNPTQKQVNKDLGKLLQEVLNRTPRTVDYQSTSIGYDPTRPFFYEGEALSIPINAEMVMLLPLKGHMTVFTDTDLDDEPTKVKK